ncbi:MAG: hypothetical protein JXL82_00285 [Candidatus Omnitrophica bacterium]|nr:hypothetical protein [Candidatus Omnitrophota bacterium]
MKAIVLISGGLDSILAAKIIKNQGIKVIPLKFNIPFYQINIDKYCGKNLFDFVKANLGEELKIADIDKEFLGLLLEPRHGFGTHMNPCIDCKILMFTKAKALMPKLGAQFIVTGEVLGQRPMSQHKRALCVIEEQSGLKGLLLRPLSAKNLNPTIPENRGWVNRDNLLCISGRSRRDQIKLARDLSISGYPNASGGCLLTDRQFSLRLNDLIRHRELNLRNIELLKFGRHFRIGPQTKLIVGRNEKENRYLEEKVKSGDLLFTPEEKVAGPTCLGVGVFDKEKITLSSRIACSYSDLCAGELRVAYRIIPDRKNKYLNASLVKKDSLAGLLV